MEKNSELIFAEQAQALSQKILAAVQESPLPLIMRRMILTQTANDIIGQINAALEAEQKRYEAAKAAEEKKEADDGGQEDQ